MSAADGWSVSRHCLRISRAGRSGIYDVRVTVDDVVIAELRGHSRTLGGTWLPASEALKMDGRKRHRPPARGQA